VQGTPLVPAEEEGAGGTKRLVVVAQHLQELRGEHDDSVLLALALTDTQDHAFAVDVLGAEGDDLGDTQAAGVDGHEQGSIVESVDGGEELSDFGLAEDKGEAFGLLLTGDAVEVPVAVQGDAVEEDEGTADLVEEAEGNAPADEVDEETTHLLLIQLVRG